MYTDCGVQFKTSKLSKRPSRTYIRFRKDTRQQTVPERHETTSILKLSWLHMSSLNDTLSARDTDLFVLVHSDDQDLNKIWCRKRQKLARTNILPKEQSGETGRGLHGRPVSGNFRPIWPVSCCWNSPQGRGGLASRRRVRRWDSNLNRDGGAKDSGRPPSPTEWQSRGRRVQAEGTARSVSPHRIFSGIGS
jgi:hypothetical protein